jgi:hypothetical protein
MDRFLIQFWNVHSSFGFMQFLSSLKNSPLCITFFPTIALETINFPLQKNIVNTNYIYSYNHSSHSWEFENDCMYCINTKNITCKTIILQSTSACGNNIMAKNIGHEQGVFKSVHLRSVRYWIYKNSVKEQRRYVYLILPIWKLFQRLGISDWK